MIYLRMKDQKSNFLFSMWAVLLRLPLAYPSVILDMLGHKSDTADTNAIFMAPLRHGEGTLTLDLYFGSPVAQKKKMIVDTGSSIAAIPCEQCHDCGSKKNTLYQNSQSLSFQTIQGCDNCQLGYCEHVKYEKGYLRGSHYYAEECQMEQSYLEDSRWEATEVSDIVSIQPPISVQEDNALSHASFPFIFGCQTSMGGLFLSQPEDGIIGMTLSENSYWYQMYSQNIIHEKKFSLCIQNKNVDYDKDTNGNNAGFITLGGSAKRLHHKPMVFAECFMDGDEWYAVNIENIFLRDNNEEITDVELKFHNELSHRMYLDSGATDTFLPKSLSEPFKKAVQKITGMEEYNDEGLTEDEISYLPSIIFQVTGASNVSQKEISFAQTKKAKVSSRAKLAQNKMIILEINPLQYLNSRDDGMYDIGIDFFSNDDDGILFGTRFMSGFDILFDMDGSRIGFAESNCDYEYYQSHITKEQ
jgi:hypothetical protein